MGLMLGKGAVSRLPWLLETINHKNATFITLGG